MRHIKLSEHIFKKGKFITPFNNLPMVKEFEDEKSWAYGRMPEYLWIGLILNHYGRDEGLRKSYNIISLLHKLAPNLYTARLSEILKLEILAFFMKLESKLLSVSLMESIVLGTTLKSVIASMISLLMLVKTLEELLCFQKMMI